MLNTMISRRIIATDVGRCRTYFNSLCPKIAICATPQTCQGNLRHFSKKRTRLRSPHRRRENFRTDWALPEELTGTAKHVEQRTVAEALGWKPIVFLLVAPLVAWGVTYAFVAPDVREKMMRDTGLKMFKKEANEAVSLSGMRNEDEASESGEDNGANFKK